MNHNIRTYRKHGREYSECGNPACQLRGRPKYVARKADKADCPYKFDAETYAAE